MAEHLDRDVVVASRTALPMPPAAIFEAESFYRFGSIEVDVGKRLVMSEGQTAKIGSRAFDLLVALLQLRGSVVEKRHLMDQVWPCTTVDESNLRFQMTCLRRALGSSCDAIKTIPGRGYFLVAESVNVEHRGRRASAVDLRSTIEIEGDANSTVAIVEDDEGVRDALDGLLRSFGFAVEVYACPEEFLRRGAWGLGCLILDVWLPGRSGLDIQAHLNAVGSDVPIVFISGHADVHMSVKAMKAGAFEFLTKPVRHEELLQAVRGAFQVRRRTMAAAN